MQARGENASKQFGLVRAGQGSFGAKRSRLRMTDFRQLLDKNRGAEAPQSEATEALFHLDRMR